jgi:starch phosphorylase
VPAGHDRFSADLIEEHLGPLREQLGISHEALMGWAARNPTTTARQFCMTVLGLKLSRRANAVSALHGEVSRAMWTGLYPGKPEDAVPIGHITNGVHVPSWLAPQMFRLYDRHLGTGWHEQKRRSQNLGRHRERRRRRALGNAPQPEVAAARLRAPPRRRAGRAPRRAPERLQRLGKVLSPDALTIGFARRFATYKRANLMLADIERLAAMVNDPKRPVQFVFAGKAHPHDEPGKRVLQQIAR